MWRFLIPAAAMIAALLVLMAGSFGNLTSLPELSAGLRGDVTRVFNVQMGHSPQGVTGDSSPSSVASASPPPVASVEQRQAAELQDRVDQRKQELASLRSDEDTEQQKINSLRQQQQHANADLQQKSADLQAQINQQNNELTSLRARTGDAQHTLDGLNQQRQSEEAALSRLQAQQRQLTTAEATTQTSRQHSSEQPIRSDRPAPTNGAMQSAVAALRAKQNNPQSTFAGQDQFLAPPTDSASRPILIVSTKGVLITARELLAAGRTAEARQVLMRGQAGSALRPVTPDQPYAIGNSVIASQIGYAIRLLDSGNARGAMEAINLAMDNLGDTPHNWPGYAEAPAGDGSMPGSP
jgi:hypothetical protein